ncbi:MAG: putative prephenate dehydrogenase [Candidatus Kaiserbacteria bacterium]|nr:putative prephenate dehydrogenase [Candidatus Kaiserbacteria bacterium]
MVNTIGIVGYGAFGKLAERLIRKFARHIKIRVWSRGSGSDSPNFATLEEAVKCDVLILAVPIRNYEEALEMIRPHLGVQTILVDIATVKGYTQELIENKFCAQPRLHTHPMFGPGSFRRTKGDVRGFPIVMTGHTLVRSKYRALKRFAKACGFRIVEMSAKEHDKGLSETLFIAHLQSQTLTRAGFLKKTSFDTPSVRLMKEAAEIVANDTELFHDVVLFNPFCRIAMIQWQKAQSFIWALLADAK